MVYPNHGDWGFVKVILDSQTEAKVADAIAYIEDDMLRSMFYQSLWDMVVAKQLSLADYVALVTANITSESSGKVVSLVHGQLYGAQNLVNRFDTKQYKQKAEILMQIEQLMWQGMKVQQATSDLQKMWFDMAIFATQSDKGLAMLVALLNQQQHIEGLEIDQDRRWSILIQLASFGHPQTSELLAKEKLLDNSYVGELSAIAVDASMPSLAVKKRWLAEFAKTSERLTAQKQKTAMSFLFPSHQSQLSKPVADQLIADLVRFDVDRDQKLIATMVHSIMPRQCSEDSVKRLAQAIENNGQLGLIALKGLKEQHQADQLCVRLSG